MTRRGGKEMRGYLQRKIIVSPSTGHICTHKRSWGCLKKIQTEPFRFTFVWYSTPVMDLYHVVVLHCWWLKTKTVLYSRPEFMESQLANNTCFVRLLPTWTLVPLVLPTNDLVFSTLKPFLSCQTKLFWLFLDEIIYIFNLSQHE